MRLWRVFRYIMEGDKKESGINQSYSVQADVNDAESAAHVQAAMARQAKMVRGGRAESSGSSSDESDPKNKKKKNSRRGNKRKPEQPAEAEETSEKKNKPTAKAKTEPKKRPPKKKAEQAITVETYIQTLFDRVSKCRILTGQLAKRGLPSAIGSSLGEWTSTLNNYIEEFQVHSCIVSQPTLTFHSLHLLVDLDCLLARRPPSRITSPSWKQWWETLPPSYKTWMLRLPLLTTASRSCSCCTEP